MIKDLIGVCVFVLVRKLGYVSQEEAAIAFAEGWYMRDEQEEACWQSVEEAFANSEIQSVLPAGEDMHFKDGELTAFYEYVFAPEQIRGLDDGF